MSGESLAVPMVARSFNEELVKNCSVCRKFTNQRCESLILTTPPELPWQRVGTDLFELKGCSYLLIVEYYSLYIEIARLNCTATEEVILRTKEIHVRHGIPEVVESDNGPLLFSPKAYTLLDSSRLNM